MAEQPGERVGEDLEGDHVDHRSKKVLGPRHPEHMVGVSGGVLVTVVGHKHDRGPAGLHLGHIEQHLVQHRGASGHADDHGARFDEGDGAVLELAAGKTLGPNVGQLLELECAFEGHRVADVAADEEEGRRVA